MGAAAVAAISAIDSIWAPRLLSAAVFPPGSGAGGSADFNELDLKG